MPVTITPIYAGLLALLFIMLSAYVIGQRRAAGIGLGDGGDATLLRRQRVHGNFSEYAPFALLLMTLAELQQAPAWQLHAIGVMLIAGRAAHAYGLNRSSGGSIGRVGGMALTLTALAAGAVANLVLALGVVFSAGP